MSPQDDPLNNGQTGAVLYRFTVQRGMLVALVIETPDWYAGLLQAALARACVEGQN